jgi:hypothetical protein
LRGIPVSMISTRTFPLVAGFAKAPLNAPSTANESEQSRMQLLKVARVDPNPLKGRATDSERGEVNPIHLTGERFRLLERCGEGMKGRAGVSLHRRRKRTLAVTRRDITL